jgi:hypothetical protein
MHGEGGEWRYSSTHSFTSALDGGEWSASRPFRFTPKERVPFTHWMGGWVGLRAVLDAVVKRKIPSPCRESNPRTPIVQPVAQRYTDWSITVLACMEDMWNVYKILTGKPEGMRPSRRWEDNIRIRGFIQKFPDWVSNETTTINTRWEATQGVMVAKLTRLTHIIAIQLHLVAERCTICSSRSRRPVRKLMDTPSYILEK